MKHNLYSTVAKPDFIGVVFYEEHTDINLFLRYHCILSIGTANKLPSTEL